MSLSVHTLSLDSLHPGLVALALAFLFLVVPCRAQEEGSQGTGKDAVDRAAIDAAIRAAATLGGFEYTDADRALMVDDVVEHLHAYQRMRAVDLPNGVPPALVFHPLGWELPRGRASSTVLLDPPVDVQRPANLEDLAWADILTLAALVRTRQVSCVELAQLSIARLKEVDPELHCVITLLEDRALAQARERDRELDEGKYRGLLHGIPWGAKDLFAVAGARTTWGAKPYEGQEIDRDAAVVQRLDDAGAVLVAKLSLGALAMGDVWFDAKTRNPWKPEQGSSGSSAGSAAAVAAGCVPFALGTETLGSIVSPSERCGDSSLRPTFGRVSRAGAMALSWSMDKVGPLCRSVTDAAIVFAAIQGADPEDPSTTSAPFQFPLQPEPGKTQRWRVGFLERAAERNEGYSQVLQDLEAVAAATPGVEVELVPVELPDYPVREMTTLLGVEAAAAFDELTRSRGVDAMVRQTKDAWPNQFRSAEMVPAVEYVRANRLRTLLCRDWGKLMEGVDVIVHPSFAGGILSATNLTGNPTVVAPAGFREDGTPFGVSFTGRPYEDDRVLTLARMWQGVTHWHERHPKM